MDKSKQTPADKRGVGRTKRKPRDPGPDRKDGGWNPADDLYGKKVVDEDLDLGGGEFSTPPPRRS
jgi:hypothetical protein